MRICKKCGKEIEEGQSYCSYCGERYEEDNDTTNNKNSLFNNLGLSQVESEKDTNKNNKNSLSNWTKVILAVLVPVLPGLGSVIGIVIGAIFMADSDEDRKTYGKALLVISIVFLVVICGCCFFSFASLSELGESIGGNSNDLQDLLREFENIK